MGTLKYETHGVMSCGEYENRFALKVCLCRFKKAKSKDRNGGN